MSETSQRRRDPFDLFGTPAVDEPDVDRGPELSELMQPSPDAAPVGPIDAFPPPAPTGATFGAAGIVEPEAPIAREPAAAPAAPTPVVEAAQPAIAPEPVEAARAAAPEPRVPTPPVRPPEPIDARKMWVLRILLISNVAMMALMLLLPHPLEPRSEYSTTEPGGAAPRTRGGTSRTSPEDPFAPRSRMPGLALPDDALYERALLLAVDGDFEGAAAQLQRMLDENPDMNPAVARLVHAQLGYYLRKAGHLPEAMEYEALVRQEAGSAQMPEDLLRQARAAELAGDGETMRRLYAEFLLQEGRLSPEMRALVPEALLKLADSYRVMADGGEGKK